MRSFFIYSVLAAGALALPAQSASESSSSSLTATTVSVDIGSTTATSSASAVASPSTDGEYWQQADITKWAKFFADIYSSDASNSSSKSAEKQSFMKHFNTVAGIVECYYDISSNASCEANVVQPATYWTRVGIKYSRDYYHKLGEKLEKYWKKPRAQATSFVIEFTHYKVNSTNHVDVVQTAMKKLKHISFDSSSSGMNIGGFGLSFASGVAAAARPNITEIFKNTKFNNLDTIKESFLNASTVVKKAAMGGLGASAVNIAWALDDVFIAKVSSNINDQKPSDMDLPILGDDARTCDNNGTCYFFVVAQEISHISKNKWVAAKGLDRVANYNMTLLDIAESAAWYQSQFGGYPSAPNSSALLESIQNDESRPSLSFFVNLPVVNYDSAKAVSSSDISTTSKDKKPTSEEEFLSTVAHEVSTLKDWPYAKMWSK